jgi:hypothetical protein
MEMASPTSHYASIAREDMFEGTNELRHASPEAVNNVSRQQVMPRQWLMYLQGKCLPVPPSSGIGMSRECGDSDIDTNASLRDCEECEDTPSPKLPGTTASFFAIYTSTLADLDRLIPSVDPTITMIPL